MNALFSIFCLSALTVLVSYAEDTCVTKSPCVCEFSNGTGIDLTSSAKADFFTAQTYQLKMGGTQYELITYYFHPCTDLLPKLNTTINDTCQQPLSICRHTDKMVLQNTTKDTFKIDGGSNELMGNVNKSSFSVDGKSLMYTQGPSSTVVLLNCAEADDGLQIYSLADPNHIVLSFYSRNACLKLIETGRSLGSTLLIIFFTFVIFYLVLGICVKKFMMGATGVEVIPNLAFWSDLPNLVKDGWAFVINGFKLPARGSGPMSSPDPNSYDSI